MYDNLMKLKIPNKWAVLYNAFCDEDMIVKEGTIENFHTYKEDLLWINECCMDSNHGYMLDENGHSLDLGWYPDSDPEGSFILRIMKPGWDNILFEYRSKERYLVAELIYHSLSQINMGSPDWDEIIEKSKLCCEKAE